MNVMDQQGFSYKGYCPNIVQHLGVQHDAAAHSHQIQKSGPGIPSNYPTLQFLSLQSFQEKQTYILITRR